MLNKTLTFKVSNRKKKKRRKRSKKKGM